MTIVTEAAAGVHSLNAAVIVIPSHSTNREKTINAVMEQKQNQLEHANQLTHIMSHI